MVALLSLSSRCPVMVAPLNRFKPSSKFYRPFIGSTSFVDLLFFLSFVCYALVRVYLYVPCGHLLRKG